MTVVQYTMDMYGNHMWPMLRFTSYVDEQGYTAILNKKWNNRDFDHTEAVAVYEQNKNKSAWFRWDEGGAWYMSTSYGEINVTVAAPNLDVAHQIMAHAEKIAPAYEETDENKVEVSFWSLSQNGPNSVTRSLDVPAWDDIRINYAKDVSNELDYFMEDNWRPTRGGQLMLWYGEPGTGKTTALRALARQWRDWCDIHYIADPERFFGTNADYMMNVLVTGDQDNDRWRLLILEDCGELIASDAKATSGQGLSRLLNVVDGLIGQGMRFLILITTNEELKKLNEAVTRPGRCLSQIEFDKLTPNEVIEWIKAHKMELPENVTSRSTIAELYAVKNEFRNKKKSKKVGFGQ